VRRASTREVTPPPGQGGSSSEATPGAIPSLRPAHIPPAAAPAPAASIAAEVGRQVNASRDAVALVTALLDGDVRQSCEVLSHTPDMQGLAVALAVMCTSATRATAKVTGIEAAVFLAAARRNLQDTALDAFTRSPEPAEAPPPSAAPGR
jgi:hypothetical protein